MYEVCVIPEKGTPGLVLFTVYETSYPTDSHVMVAVVNVLDFFICTKCKGAAGGPVACLIGSVISTLVIHHCTCGEHFHILHVYTCSPDCTHIHVDLS